MTEATNSFKQTEIGPHTSPGGHAATPSPLPPPPQPSPNFGGGGLGEGRGLGGGERAFKDTEIGPIPVEWEVTTIGELVQDKVLRLLNGFPCGNHNQEGRGIPHLRPFNVDGEGNVSLDAIKYIETDRDVQRYLLASGDVLFNNTNSEDLVGKTAYWDRPGRYVLSNHMTLVRVLDDDVVDSFYLSKYLHKLWYDRFYRSICRRHVNQASISLTRLKGVPVALPPLPEQRRIAHVLNTIQRAIATQDKLIAAARELKRSLMQHLFTYGPVPLDQAGQVRLKETEIGPVPEHWEVVRLGDIADARGGSAFPHKYQGQKEGKYPFYKVSDMNLPGNETHMRTANNWVGEQTIRALRARPFPKDTVIFPKVGGAVYTNKKRLLTVEALVDNNVMGVSVREKGRCVPEYLFFWFESIDLRQFSNPGPLPSIAARAVKKALLPLPPLPEQHRIVHMLSAVERRIEAEERRRAALQVLFKTMLHQLMRGRIRLRDVEFKG